MNTPPGIGGYEYLEILARADLEHAATCPYCLVDRMAELHAEAEDSEARKPAPAPVRRAA